MANLDPATLEKFQRFQAMLAASPEIVEALNSPEILALAAKAAEEKKNAEPVLEPEPQPELGSEPEPEYPVVGYGISDEVSVMSEMTTPTVMTRQTVEEDEFYPEIDVTGKSTSGIHSGPRRIGLKIGVSAYKDGDLPPPPPKSKPKSRHHRSTTRKIKPIAPMSKIVETDASSTTEGESTELKSSTEFDASGKQPIKSKKNTWKPITVSPVLSERKEPHPFLVSSGAGTRRTARHSSYTNRSSRKGTKSSRGINRNRSMPVNIKLSSSGSASSGSLQEEDDITKASSESISTPSVSKEKPKTKPKTKSLSPTRPSGNVDLGNGTEKPSTPSAPIKRGVTRNQSLPSTSKKSSCSLSSNSVVDDDTTKTTSESVSSPSKGKGKSLLPTKNDTDDANMTSSGGRKKRGKSVPKMRLVPVLPMKNKSIVSNNSSPAKLTQPDQTMSRPRGRSLSKRRTPSKEGISKSHSPEEKTILSKNDRKSDPINDSEGSSSVSSIELSESESSNSPSPDNSTSRISVTRRWKAPLSNDSAIPPAFRSSSQRFKYSGSNHSGKSLKSSSSRLSSNGTKSVEPKEGKSPNSSHSGKSLKPSSRVSGNESKLEEPKESRSEEPKDVSSSSEEDDYVRQTVRKPEKVVSRPNSQQFKQYMTEITQVIQGDTSTPDDYLPGSGSPFTATRKKKLQSVKKRFKNTAEVGGPRPEDWLGSGKVRKRSWKVKKPVEC